MRPCTVRLSAPPPCSSGRWPLRRRCAGAPGPCIRSRRRRPIPRLRLRRPPPRRRPAPAHPRPCRRHPRSARRTVSTPDFRLNAPPTTHCRSVFSPLRALFQPPISAARSPARAAVEQPEGDCIAAAGPADRRIEAARAGGSGPGNRNVTSMSRRKQPVAEHPQAAFEARLGRTLDGARPVTRRLRHCTSGRRSEGASGFQVVEEAPPAGRPVRPARRRST